MNNLNNPCVFYIVRHGKTDWNNLKLIQGQADRALNTEGVQQIENLNQQLKDIHFDFIFSSDLLRARQTADILAKERQLAVTTSSLIRERKFGSLEGKSTEALKTIVDAYRSLADEEINAHKVDPEYESNNEVIARVITFLREVAVAYAGKTVLVVSHSSLLRALLIHLGYTTHKDAPFRLIRNGGYVKIASDGVEFTVLEVNPGGVIG